MNISLNDLAIRCNIHKDKISKIEDGHRNFTFITFLELAKGLGKQPKKLLDKDLEFLKEE